METQELIESIEYILQEDFLNTFVQDYDTPDVYMILQEFFEDKKQGRTNYFWKLIPKTEYHNVLNAFNEDKDLDKYAKQVYDWLELIAYNVMVLDIFTELAGHTKWFPFDEVNDMLFDDEADYVTEYEDAFEKLDELGFYDWAKLPDGTDAISDYGREPICKILQSLDDMPTVKDAIVAINKCLDVVHCRGDLASAFIEGGCKSCSEISNWKNESIDDKCIEIINEVKRALYNHDRGVKFFPTYKDDIWTVCKGTNWGLHEPNEEFGIKILVPEDAKIIDDLITELNHKYPTYRVCIDSNDYDNLEIKVTNDN